MNARVLADRTIRVAPRRAHIRAAPRVGISSQAPPRGHSTDPIVLLLLVVGFFVGPIKMLWSPWVGYLLPDMLTAAALLIIFSERLATGHQLFARSPLTTPILLLSVYCMAELLNPEAPLLRSVLGLRSWLLYLGFYFVGFCSFRSVAQLKRLYGLLLVLAVVTSLYGIKQWYAGPESFANWSEHYARYAAMVWEAENRMIFRAFSTFISPGAFAGNMSLIMVIAFTLVMSASVRLVWRYTALGAVAILASAIAVSGSRGPIIHLALMALLAVILAPGLRPRVKVGVAFTVVLAVVSFTLTATEISATVADRYRTLLTPVEFVSVWYERILSSIANTFRQPFGRGLGYSAGIPAFLPSKVFASFPRMNVDSGYASAAFELGLLGLAVFTYFAVKVGVEGCRAWRRLKPGLLRDLFLAPALWAGTYPIITIVYQPQASLPMSPYFWLLIGALMKASAVQPATIQASPHAHRVFRTALYVRQ